MNIGETSSTDLSISSSTIITSTEKRSRSTSVFDSSFTEHAWEELLSGNISIDPSFWKDLNEEMNEPTNLAVSQLDSLRNDSMVCFSLSSRRISDCLGRLH